ncbi:NAD(P)H-binding protein [Dyella sp. 2RAB6]|uniref:NAD(P)H-binding protein n=1 Tax=Dyella sp. 2RAB6 TaxID=3232992 RepID=UPI003F93E276
MYLVTGASGNIGGSIARQLLEAGHPVRVFARDPARLGELAERVEIAQGDFSQPDSLGAAALGTRAVFLNTGPNPSQLPALLAGLKANGAPRVVFLSSILAGDPAFLLGRMHRANEDALLASGLRTTVLRPTGFMTNTLRWADSIRADDVVYNAMGSGKAPPIAPEDIAAVAVRALLDPALAGQTLELTGGELLNVPEQVEILSGLLGRTLRSVDVSIEQTVQGLVATGIPEPLARGIAQSLEAVRDGRGRAMTPTVEQITGAAPRTFRAWAHTNAAHFA